MLKCESLNPFLKELNRGVAFTIVSMMFLQKELFVPFGTKFCSIILQIARLEFNEKKRTKIGYQDVQYEPNEAI